MKTARYHCAHCGRRFEAEEREIVECPGCFWTTSVKKDEGRESASAAPKAAAPERSVPRGPLFPKPDFSALPWQPILIFLLIAALAGPLVYFDIPSKIRQAIPARAKAISIPGVSNKTEKAVPAAQPSQSAAPTALSDEDKAILGRDLSASLNGDLTGEEKAAIEKEVPLKTGIVEQLPSAAWTLDIFEKMLKDEQARYKISFPRSYRNKLIDLFKSKYLPAAKAFQEERLLEARNGWVQSLAFPLYSTDLRKHRGVALTILRPFINDTLSKIAALNNLLRVKNVRGREQELNQQYAEFRNAAVGGDWQRAAEAGRKLEEGLLAYQTNAFHADGPPPYPAELSQIDLDIAFPLNQLLQAPDPAIADVSGMLQDVREKQRIIGSRAASTLEEQTNAYKSALASIQAGDYKKAAEDLRKVRFPAGLATDAAEKLRVLEKVQNQNLDSSSK